MSPFVQIGQEISMDNQKLLEENMKSWPVVMAILMLLPVNLCVGSMTANTFTDGVHNTKLRVGRSHGQRAIH